MAQTLRVEVDHRRDEGRAGASALAKAVASLKLAGGGVSDDLFADLEVAFRGSLGGLLRGAAADVIPAVESLVSLAVGYALVEADAATASGLPAPPTGKLPFLLFEDLLDAVPLEVSNPLHLLLLWEYSLLRNSFPAPMFSLSRRAFSFTLIFLHISSFLKPAFVGFASRTFLERAVYTGGARTVVSPRRLGAARSSELQFNRAP